jgi:uncharacterized protein YndB with AHSA1/START domain
MAYDPPRHPIGFGLPGTTSGSPGETSGSGVGDRTDRRPEPVSPPDRPRPESASTGDGRSDHPSSTEHEQGAADRDHDPAQRDRDVHRRVVLETNPAETWSLLTDADELAAWWGDGTTIELTPGGDARFREDGEPDRQGRVVEVKPGRRLVFDWWPEDPEVDEPASRVTIELVPCPFGTVVTITECVLLPLDELPVLVTPRPTFLPSPWGPGPSALARARVLVLA